MGNLGDHGVVLVRGSSMGTLSRVQKWMKERNGGSQSKEKFIELRRISKEKGANRILTTLKAQRKNRKDCKGYYTKPLIPSEFTKDLLPPSRCVSY